MASLLFTWKVIVMQNLIDSIKNKMNLYIKENGIIYSMSATAPDTYERLVAECTPTRLIVWDGASESSVWGLEGNYLFRAVHDSVHIEYGLAFTDADEAAVCYKTIELLKLNKAEAEILEAEIVGQLEYKNIYGYFPVNQTEFLLSYINHKREKLII